MGNTCTLRVVLFSADVKPKSNPIGLDRELNAAKEDKGFTFTDSVIRSLVIMC